MLKKNLKGLSKQNKHGNVKAFAKYGLSRLVGKHYCDNPKRAIREALMLST